MEFLLNLVVVSPMTMVRVLILLIEFLYICFSFVLYKQGKLMSQTVEVPISNFFQFLTIAHLIGSILIFIFSIFILDF